MRLQGRKVGVLLESDFYEHEISYYQYRFPEEGVELHFLTRLWGQPSLTFTGHEYRAPMQCTESFEGMMDDELRSYDAIIVPSGMVADRLRYTEDVTTLPPASAFLKRAFAEPGIIKGIICHGLWLAAPVAECVQGRRLTCHNNLIGDARAYGAIYENADVVVDGDLVTGRSGAQAGEFARTIINLLEARVPASKPAFSHVALSCADMTASEQFYVRHFGFARARVVPIGDGREIVFLRSGPTCLELFPAEGPRKEAAPVDDGAHTVGVRHIAFQVQDVDATMRAIGDDARVTLGPFSFDAVIPGWRTVWVSDPDGNIVEISQGYVDQDNPPSLTLPLVEA